MSLLAAAYGHSVEPALTQCWWRWVAWAGGGQRTGLSATVTQAKIAGRYALKQLRGMA